MACLAAMNLQWRKVIAQLVASDAGKQDGNSPGNSTVCLHVNVKSSIHTLSWLHAITVKAIHELPVYTEGGTDSSVSISTCIHRTVYQPRITMFVVRSVLRLINDPFYV